MGFPFLLPAPRLAKCMIREYRPPIIISSKSEIFFACERSKGVRTADRGKYRVHLELEPASLPMSSVRRIGEIIFLWG